MSLKNNIINNWTLDNVIGTGAFGNVYSIKNKDLVIKLIDKKKKKHADTLYYEYNLIVGQLNDFKFKPKYPTAFYGETVKYRYLVMEKLDMTLSDLSKNYS